MSFCFNCERFIQKTRLFNGKGLPKWCDDCLDSLAKELMDDREVFIPSEM